MELLDVRSVDIAGDGTSRWDRKYWVPTVRDRMATLVESNAPSIGSLNQIETRRGRSPQSAQYVSHDDGYAVVVKAGSCITKFGEIDISSADWIEKNTFDDVTDDVKLEMDDILLASTGEGTLGKCAVWNLDVEAIADGHVTIIRVDPTVVDPHYLADYLRCGFGYDQIRRLFTGSTNLIELTAEHVDRIVVAVLGGVDEQRRLSIALRNSEADFRSRILYADASLFQARAAFEAESSTHEELGLFSAPA